MILVQNWKLLVFFVFFNKVGLEIMFDYHLFRKQDLLDFKKAYFTK